MASQMRAVLFQWSAACFRFFSCLTATQARRRPRGAQAGSADVAGYMLGCSSGYIGKVKHNRSSSEPSAQSSVAHDYRQASSTGGLRTLSDIARAWSTCSSLPLTSSMKKVRPRCLGRPLLPTCVAAVYANTLVFSGRMLALAFFRLEGVAHKLLSSLPPVKRTALKRVLDELGPPSRSVGWLLSRVPPHGVLGSSTNPGGSRFPDHLAHLAFVDLTSYCRLFGSGQQSGSEPLVREGEVEVEMSGNWFVRSKQLSRSCADAGPGLSVGRHPIRTCRSPSIGATFASCRPVSTLLRPTVIPSTGSSMRPASCS